MTLDRSLSKLVKISSEPLSMERPQLTDELSRLLGSLADEFLALLSEKNGFFAFESALHVFSTASSRSHPSLSEWNSREGWRKAYKEIVEDCLFFAEDVFGGQFCIHKNRVCTFDPETGDRKIIGTSLASWAKDLLSDFNVMTGYPIAHAWQLQYGVLPAGKRLIPKIPFVFGGEFNLSNLTLMDAIEGMEFRASLARQIHDLPDESRVRFVVGP